VTPGGRWRNVYSGPDGGLFENSSVSPRFFAKSGLADVAIEQLAPGRFRLEVVAGTAARIGSSQLGGSGWLVRGAQKVPGTFIEMLVPAGKSSIDVVYQPLSFWLSLIVGIGLTPLPLCVVPAGKRSLKNKP
jgi:hypothetical protein